MVELRPFSSLSTGCVVSLRGDWAIFCYAGSGRVGRVWSARENSLEILRRGWELNPGHRENRQWAIPLSYHDPGHGEDRQWAIPLSYHDPGHREDRQWAIPLSYHDWLIRWIDKGKRSDLNLSLTRLWQTTISSCVEWTLLIQILCKHSCNAHYFF